jgi:hypothetical protein
MTGDLDHREAMTRAGRRGRRFFGKHVQVKIS